MSDKFDRLRYIGYCWAKLPPGDDDSFELDDFVAYCKFQLCRATNRLIKDPIWDEYTVEEILVEYYALLYHNNEEQAQEFLKKLSGVSQNDYDWILAQDEENTQEVLDKEGDSIKFDPTALGD